MPSSDVVLRYSVPRSPPDSRWDLEGLRPESDAERAVRHHVVESMAASLAAWAASSGAYHVAVGVDRDVCVSSSPPGEGNAAPLLAMEVVSELEPRKDYAVVPERYAASDIQELVVFDPLLSGPHAFVGPHRLRVWQRTPDGVFVRTHAGDGPAYSAVLGAHLVVVLGGRALRISDDPARDRP